MPSINLQVQIFRGDSQGNPVIGPDGNPVAAPPSAALVVKGPAAPLVVSLHSASVAGLQPGQVPPSPVSGLGLIDTGASLSCIDTSVVQKLGLYPINQMKMSSASHADHVANVYAVKFEIQNLLDAEIAKVAEAALMPQGFIALIGRDVLSKATMFYNGPTGQVTVSI